MASDDVTNNYVNKNSTKSYILHFIGLPQQYVQHSAMAAGGACEQLSRLSLEAAIRDKYCSEDERDTQPAHKDIKESAIAFRPGEQAT